MGQLRLQAGWFALGAAVMAIVAACVEYCQQ
jgi:hypothetical protein